MLCYGMPWYKMTNENPRGCMLWYEIPMLCYKISLLCYDMAYDVKDKYQHNSFGTLLF